MVEVVTTGERDIPTIRQTDVTTEVQVLRELIRIAHAVVIKLTSGILTHGDTIAKADRPRHGELHITILIGLGHTGIFLTGTMLTSLQRVVEVAIKTRIVLVIAVALIVFALVLVFVRHLLATQPLEELSHLLIAQRVRQVLRHALETTKATVAILRAVTDIRTGTHRVCLVGISGKGGIEVKCIALRQFQTQTGVQVTPWTRLCSEVI